MQRKGSSNVLTQNSKATNQVRSTSPIGDKSSKIVRPDSGLSKKKEPHSAPAKQSEHRNENILCAVLALLKELGDSELELVKRDIDRKLGSSKH